MTEDQKAIERIEFACEDGLQVVAEMRGRSEAFDGPSPTVESQLADEALQRAIKALSLARTALEQAYRAVGNFEKSVRRGQRFTNPESMP